MPRLKVENPSASSVQSPRGKWLGLTSSRDNFGTRLRPPGAWHLPVIQGEQGGAPGAGRGAPRTPHTGSATICPARRPHWFPRSAIPTGPGPLTLLSP